MSTRHLLCFIGTFVSCTQAVPARTPNIRDDNAISRFTETTCGFEGNSDIYGLGIRLGLYLQWLSAYLTRHLLPEAVPDLAGVTFIFEFALLVAALVLSKSTIETYATELVILIAMLLADTWLVHVPIYFPCHSCQQRPTFSVAGIFARNLMMIAIAVFAIWFAVSGYDLYRRDPCGTYLFFFVRLPNPSSRVGAQGLLVGVAYANLAYLILLSASEWSPIRWAHVMWAVPSWLTKKRSARNMASGLLLPLQSPGAKKRTEADKIGRVRRALKVARMFGPELHSLDMH